MRSGTALQSGVKPNLAQRQIDAFLNQFGGAHLDLAYHAAFPLALTPDLLYRLWANFQRDSQAQVLNIPWIAVSDVLLHLCDEVGHELYEFDRAVRQELLQRLQADSRLGLARLRELADFVLVQVEPDLCSADPDRQEFAKTQKWGALAYKQPEIVARDIALFLSQLSLTDKTEWVRFSGLLDTLADPLADYSTLRVYAQAMADFVRGRLQSAVAKIHGAINANQQVQVAGVNLPIPEEILAELPPPAPPTQPESLWLTWLKHHRLHIGGGTLSLVIVVGVVYLHQTGWLSRVLPQLNLPQLQTNQPESQITSPTVSASPSLSSAETPSIQPDAPSTPTASPQTPTDQNLNDAPNFPPRSPIAIFEDPARSLASPTSPTPTNPSPTATATPGPSESNVVQPAPETEPPAPNSTGNNADPPQPTPGGNSLPASPGSNTVSTPAIPPPGSNNNPETVDQSSIQATLNSIQVEQYQIREELGTLRGRVAQLEAAVSALEAGQSTRSPFSDSGRVQDELTSIREAISQLEQKVEANIQAISNLLSSPSVQQPVQQSVKQEDPSSLQRLNEEFAAELATLRGRVDALNGRVNNLPSSNSSNSSTSSSSSFSISSGSSSFSSSSSSSSSSSGSSSSSSFFSSSVTRAEIQQVVGTVEIVSSNGVTRPAQAGDVLVIGDTLRTGANSSAELLFNEGSIGRIGASSVFRMAPGLRQFQTQPSAGTR